MKKTMNGALVLAVAALVAKILSAIYRIPFQNIVGNTGFYVYQQVYPIYGIGMTFALNGLPVFISKLVAQKDDEKQRMKIVSQVFALLSCLAIVIFLLLQVDAKVIASWMGDIQLAPLISSVSWMFLLMPFLASARGYYQGTFKMMPTAISQVSEQFVRVALIIGVALLSSNFGWDVYKTGSLAMLGSVFGAIVALLTFLTFWRYFLKKADFSAAKADYYQVFRLIFKDGMIICLFSALMVFLQLVDSFTVMNALKEFGSSVTSAKFTKGIYDRGQPLVQLGMTIAISFSSTLLPSLTAALKQKKIHVYRNVSSGMLHIGSALSVAATAGMICLMPQLNTLLFGDSNLSLTISIYVLSVPLISIISIYNSILQSVGNFFGTFLAVVTALVTKILLNAWLIKLYGIIGASICTIISLGAALLVLILILPRSVRQRPNEFLVFICKLVVCIVLMIVGIIFLEYIWTLFFALNRVNCLAFVPLMIIVGAVLFIGCALKSHLFTQEEWETLPGGSKIIERNKLSK